MSIVPDHRIGKLAFYESHLPAWSLHAAEIGLNAASVAALGVLTAAARADYDAHIKAQNAARAATQKFYDSVRAMHAGPGAGADMIQTIKTHAQVTSDPAVYALAMIPSPSTAGATAPPGTPFKFTTALREDGSIELKWKCGNPSGTVGTIYEVMRSVNGGAMTFVGATGVKSFADDTLPSGSANVTYQVTAIRSTARGKPAQFTVNFGVGSIGGGMTITSVTGADGGAGGGVKIAA